MYSFFEGRLYTYYIILNIIIIDSTSDFEKPITTIMTENDHLTVNSTTEDIVESANDTLGNWNVTIDNAVATGIDPHTKSKG